MDSAPAGGPADETTAFDRHTASRPVGGGRHEVRIHPSWWIVAGPNGGYVAAIVLRAVEVELAAAAPGDAAARRLRSATLHFLRAPAEGPAEVEVRTERAGRTVSTVSAVLRQGGRTMVLALVTSGTDRPGAPEFDEDPGLPLLGDGRPVPLPEDLPAAPVDPDRDVPMRSHYELRWVLGDPPFRPGAGGSAPTARCGGWIRLAERRPVDEVLLAALADAWLPPVFSRSDRPLAVPTVDLTVHFRARPAVADDWCFVDVASPVARDGYLVEHARLHDRHGLLLAEARQLAVVA